MRENLIIIGSVLALVAAALTGCKAELEVNSKSSGPTKIAVPYEGSSTVSEMSISEMCYDHVKYLVNTKGGMTPKVDPSSVGVSLGAIPSPFMKC